MGDTAILDLSIATCLHVLKDEGDPAFKQNITIQLPRYYYDLLRNLYPQAFNTSNH